MVHPWIVGPGRLGLAITVALSRSDSVGRITISGRDSAPIAHAAFDGRVVSYTPISIPPPDPTLILLTVPDRAIPTVAEALARLPLPTIPVLHTSGVLSAGALAPFRTRGHPAGSLHPLAAVPATADAAERLVGSFFGVEGDPPALHAAGRIVQILKGRALEVDASGKVAYHTAAVFASNYVVALLSVAEGLMVGAGVELGVARVALAELAKGAVENVANSGPESLTGPISRGDTETIERHLSGLSPQDRRLYSELARAALEIARQQGLVATAIDRIEATLQAGSS